MIRFAAFLTLLAAPAVAESPFPLAIGGPYDLTNQYGQPHSQVDPDGRAQLLFFGYANCQQICSAALPMMADIADLVAEAGHDVTPVMITVDPARDTVEDIKSCRSHMMPSTWKSNCCSRTHSKATYLPMAVSSTFSTRMVNC